VLRLLEPRLASCALVVAHDIKAEANLDGKYLLRSSDPHLSAEDIALGYKQLLQVERGWCDMKQIIDLRPVYHRLEERIRAHVILCSLALLLIRIAETSTGQTWPAIRAQLQRPHIGTFSGPAGLFRRRTEITKPQRDLLAKLDLPTRRRSSSWTPPADQRTPQRLETRPHPSRSTISAAQPPVLRSSPPELRGTRARDTALTVASMIPAACSGRWCSPAPFTVGRSLSARREGAAGHVLGGHHRREVGRHARHERHD
jgi:hypothetical protein